MSLRLIILFLILAVVSACKSSGDNYFTPKETPPAEEVLPGYDYIVPSGLEDYACSPGSVVSAAIAAGYESDPDSTFYDLANNTKPGTHPFTLFEYLGIEPFQFTYDPDFITDIQESLEDGATVILLLRCKTHGHVINVWDWCEIDGGYSLLVSDSTDKKLDFFWTDTFWDGQQWLILEKFYIYSVVTI